MERFDADTFLRTQVAPHLAELEQLRLRALVLYLVGGLLVGAGVIGFAVQRDSAGFDRVVPSLVCAVPGLAILGFGRLAQSRRRTLFKQVVMKQLLGAAYPTLEYAPDHCISEALYRASGLFRRSYDRYTGDDYVSGRIGETDLSFSELHTEYKTETRDSKGRKTTHWHTIFRGIFFVADFHKHFAGTTYVLPDQAQRLLGDWLGQGLQGLASSHGEIVKLEDPRFEQAFVTYASDQQEARYILTPSLMERMLALRDRFGVPTHFSFVDASVHVAIATGGSHFEPGLWDSGVSRAQIEAHLSLIRSVLEIVEDLKLNTRIWTKS